MLTLLCAAVIGTASPCQAPPLAAFAPIPLAYANELRASARQDRLPRLASAEPLRERFYPVASELDAVAHLERAEPVERMALAEPTMPVPTPAPERPRKSQPEPVIAKVEVDLDIITAAYARADRPAAKFPLPLPEYGDAEKKTQPAVAKVPPPLPEYGEAERKAQPAVAKPHRSRGIFQLASAAGGLRDLVRRTEEAREKAAEQKADSGFQGLYILADGNEEMGCVQKNQRLMLALRKVRARYGKAVIIDSAYRSPAYNRMVNGAKNSYHMSCMALDISVAGVGKDELRDYVRTLPEIGGVGIYASGSIHMDTGPVRNWDWRRKSRKGGAEV